MARSGTIEALLASGKSHDRRIVSVPVSRIMLENADMPVR